MNGTRKTDHLLNTGRLVALALVFITTGYAPATASGSEFILSQHTSTGSTASERSASLHKAFFASQSFASANDTGRASQQRTAHYAVATAFLHAPAPDRTSFDRTATPLASAQKPFTAPPPQRGPPALS